MKFTDILRYIPELVAAIGVGIPLIKTLIEQFETPGFGEEKQQAVLDALQVAMEGFGFRPAVVTGFMAIATGSVKVFVAFKNLIGEFTHGEGEPGAT